MKYDLENLLDIDIEKVKNPKKKVRSCWILKS